MAAATLLAVKKFASLFFKTEDVMIFNGMIALGTVAGQTAYNVFAFNCPCSSGRNYSYGLAAIGLPALLFFVLGIIMSKSARDLVFECRPENLRKLSPSTAFVLLGTIICRAGVAPVTWAVISLLRGKVYTCALCEFVDPSTVEGLPKDTGAEVLAKFPCEGNVPGDLQKFWPVIERRLKFESQLIGWLLLAGMSLMVLVILCMKRYSNPFGHQQERYRKLYDSTKKAMFERTAHVHASVLAAQHVKDFFGFVCLDKEEQEEMEQYQQGNPIPPSNWNKVDLCREHEDIPITK